MNKDKSKRGEKSPRSPIPAQVCQCEEYSLIMVKRNGEAGRWCHEDERESTPSSKESSRPDNRYNDKSHYPPLAF